jgi:hypothetical protein
VRLVICIPGLLLLTACAAPPLPYSQFTAGDLAPVERWAEEQIKEDETSEALYLNTRATCELLRGDRAAARRDFFKAGRIMGNWAASGGSVAAAIIGSESSKEYRGDPYEVAMNSIYAGLLFWMDGEFDTCRAGAKAAILADGDSEKEEFRSDFALLYWIAGRMSRRMGLNSDAEDFYKEARQAQQNAVAAGSRGESNNPVLEHPDQGNVVLFVDVGMGPTKYADGPQGSVAKFRPASSREAFASVTVDGQPKGRTHVMADLDFQAMTRGGRYMDGILAGKAVFKTATTVAGAVVLGEALNNHDSKHAGTAAIVGGSLLLLGLLTSAEADTRHWAVLPSTVQLMTLDLTPGRHDVRIEFCDAGGFPLPALTQSWHLEVSDRVEEVYYFRSIPGLDRLPDPAASQPAAPEADKARSGV